MTAQLDTLLVVDDDPVNRMLLKRVLTRKGYRVFVSPNGSQALSLLKSGGIHLVLLDVMMPDMDGFEVLSRIRESHGVSELPVIMVTALGQSADITRALSSGANDFITKPVDIPVVLARIRTHLFLINQNRILNILAQAQARFIAGDENTRVFQHLLQDLMGLTHSEYGFIGEVLFSSPDHPYLQIYAENGQADTHDPASYPRDMDRHPGFLKGLLDSGTILKCDLRKNENEASELFSGAHPLHHVSLYPLTSYSEHLGLVGFANRPGGYGPNVSEQLEPVWRTISHILMGIKSHRRQKEAERAQKLSEQRMRNILDAALDGIIAINGQGQIELFNPAAQHIFNYAPGEILGQKASVLLPLGYSDALEKEFRGDVPQGQPEFIGQNREIIGERKDGSVFPMSLSINQAVSPDGTVFMAIARDITEEKKAREHIRFQNTLLECQSNASLDGILVVDSSRRWLYANRNFLDMWGLPPDMPMNVKSSEAIGRIIDQVENPEQFMGKIKALYDHPLQHSQDEVAFKDGRIFERYSAPVQGPEDILYGRVWFYRDITQRKKDSEALEKARNQEIDIASSIQEALLLG